MTIPNECDICDRTENVTPGRWIFYCPEHKQNDIDMTLDNEILPSLESGDIDYLLSDGELSDMVEAYL